MRPPAKAPPRDTWLSGHASSGIWRRRIVISAVLLLAAPLSFLYLNQTSSLAAAGYDVAVLENEKKLWQMRNEQLRLQVTQLESLDRIDRLATTKLGMGPPQHPIYVNAPSAPLPPPPSPQVKPTPTPSSLVSAVLERLSGSP